ncbi:hypothetical protein [Falsiroseomonas tokyonensis]|uniref:DUF3644 domain-containing protein n=1 Tax=Falsiroseomonas tokyonensis TaxID=430521 RepID=A0ABV7BUP5_9PROT|nr:hypothetical protein [Falsiroseomonas tokyonensis]MBU8538715.1 hypothetical protein [Falsiroseomonas tokyonensis]
MTLYLNESHARRRFKELLGQANHMIVTILVGLDAVEQGLVTAPPPDLHAAWSPANPVNSARRARRLVLDMVLVRSVDAVDVYLRMCRRSPGLIQEVELKNGVDGAGRSVFNKILALEKRYWSESPVLFSLVSVMVAWRNKGAHEEADTEVSDLHRKTLRDNAADIASVYRGLDVERLLVGFDSAAPTFKEVASLISAAQNFIHILEIALFRDLDADQYLRELVWKAPPDVYGNYAYLFRKKRLQSIWGRDYSERPTAVRRYLRQFGLVTDRRHDHAATFSASAIDRLCARTPLEVFEWANPEKSVEVLDKKD